MKPDAADNSVPREISALLSNGAARFCATTQRAVIPLGGVAVFVAFLHKLGFVEKLRQHMPIQLKSPNHIDPTATFTAFLIAVLAGARRFAHTNWLRGDRAFVLSLLLLLWHRNGQQQGRSRGISALTVKYVAKSRARLRCPLRRKSATCTTDC